MALDVRKARGRPYPNTVLVDRIRAEGFPVQCAWEVKGPPGVAWLTCYIIYGSPERQALGTVIVQTFYDHDGWTAWLPSDDSNNVDTTVAVVIERATAMKEESLG